MKIPIIRARIFVSEIQRPFIFPIIFSGVIGVFDLTVASKAYMFGFALPCRVQIRIRVIIQANCSALIGNVKNRVRSIQFEFGHRTDARPIMARLHHRPVEQDIFAMIFTFFENDRAITERSIFFVYPCCSVTVIFSEQFHPFAVSVHTVNMQNITDTALRIILIDHCIIRYPGIIPERL